MNQYINDEPTNQMILDAVNNYATRLEKQIHEFRDETNDRFAKIDDRFAKIDDRFAKSEGRFDKMEIRLDRIEAMMVTKDYLDDKLADLKGSLVQLIRKEDDKVNMVITPLHDRGVLNDSDLTAIHKFDPFPRAS